MQPARLLALSLRRDQGRVRPPPRPVVGVSAAGGVARGEGGCRPASRAGRSVAFPPPPSAGQRATAAISGFLPDRRAEERRALGSGHHPAGRPRALERGPLASASPPRPLQAE